MRKDYIDASAENTKRLENHSRKDYKAKTKIRHIKLNENPEIYPFQAMQKLKQ
jgi:hypothetical protein